MASLEQWTTWREEYLDGLNRTIDDVPYELIRRGAERNNETVDIEKSKRFVAEGVDSGYINENDPDYHFKVFFFACYALSEENEGVSAAFEEYKDTVKDIDKELEAYLSVISFAVILPLLGVCNYVLKNNPFALKSALVGVNNELRNPLKWESFRLGRKELFAFLRSMTPYGLHKLLTEIKVPIDYYEELFEAIRRGYYKDFKAICREGDIDFTEIAEIAGCIQELFDNQLAALIESITSDEEASNSEQEHLDNQLHSMFSILGQNVDECVKFLKDFASDSKIVGRFLPALTNNAEYVEDVANLALGVYGLLLYIESFGIEEVAVINGLLENSMFEPVLRISEILYCACLKRFPERIKTLFTPEEQAEIIALCNNLGASEINSSDATCRGNATDADELKQNKPVEILEERDREKQIDKKTLASRWMTEPYHRMSDAVLVDILSRQIWPKLIEEVDNLKWVPQKRTLPTFQKTKNLLAASILFHSMELANVAKLPKQEDADYDYDGLYGDGDRLQAEVVTTSKLRAGIASTKKEYNGTLPVGYMDVLEKFLDKSEMPGRTTSRTYLKLVNKWVKIKFENSMDSMDSQVSARLIMAECQEDLGPQVYLLTDNRKRIKAILTEWRDTLPDLLNIPI